jgi:hypothetical protein
MRKKMKAGMYGFMVLGLLFLGFGCYFIIEATFSTNWDKIEGEIISTKIPIDFVNVNDPIHRYEIYSVEVTYEYEVAGEIFQNNQYSIGSGSTVKGRFNEKSEAIEWLKNSDFAIGKKVKVYVKPNKPSETILSSGINIGTIVPMLIGLLFLLVAYGLRFVVKFEENSKKTASTQYHG